jgi:hypothetical protein
MRRPEKAHRGRVASLLLLLTALGALLATPVALAQRDEAQPATAAPPEMPGHPPVDGAREAPPVPGMFEPPPDTVDDDANVPVGSIQVEVRDPDGNLLPGIGVTLGILHQSVAKGERSEHVTRATDERGVVTFAGLSTGSDVAYRVSVPKDGATFAATPFRLGTERGMKVVLHVYPVTDDITQALIVIQFIVYAELKDDRLQFQQAVTVFNFGRTAWVPTNLVMGLPEGFTALTAGQQMSDTGVDAVEGRGARLRGTFSPGRHDVQYRWQLPYTGDRELNLDLGLPPHVAVARVMAAASKDMRLVVEGFPEAVSRTDPEGQRLLITERQLRREDGSLRALHIGLRGLPGEGVGKFIASGISAIAVFSGLALAWSSRRRGAERDARATKAERAQLLEELEELERARRDGDIGPKTYERLRRALIAAIARTLLPAGDAPSGASDGRRSAEARKGEAVASARSKRAGGEARAAK